MFIFFKSEPITVTKLGIIVSGRLGHNFNDFSKKIDKNYMQNL